MENVIDPPHFGHNGPKAQEIANELCPGTYLQNVQVHVTSMQEIANELCSDMCTSACDKHAGNSQ